MTKLLATTILLLTLLVSPLMAKEKILKCYTQGDASKAFSQSEFYKMKSSVFGRKSYFVKDNLDWIPFCKGEKKFLNKSNKKDQKEKTVWKIIKREKSNTAISCEYEKKYEYESNEISLDCFLSESKTCPNLIKKGSNKFKMTIDFELATSSYCYGEKRLKCHPKFQNYKCDVVKD